MVRQEGDLAGPEAETAHVVEVEVLELVGPDDALGGLGGLLGIAGHRSPAAGRGAGGRDQLGGDLRVQDRLEYAVGRSRELARRDDPADQVLDQRLGHGGVHVVVGHVVAHSVRTPSEGQLAEVSRSNDESVVLIGEAEEVARPLSCLDVLEGHIVHRLSPGERVANVLEHLA